MHDRALKTTKTGTTNSSRLGARVNNTEEQNQLKLNGCEQSWKTKPHTEPNTRNRGTEFNAADRNWKSNTELNSKAGQTQRPSNTRYNAADKSWKRQRKAGYNGAEQQAHHTEWECLEAGRKL